MPIVIQKFYPVDIGAERAEPNRRASFRGRTRKERDFLFETVRGYRGPKHPWVTEKCANKIEKLARAAGFSVAIKERPKPTKAEVARTVSEAKKYFASVYTERFGG